MHGTPTKIFLFTHTSFVHFMDYIRAKARNCSEEKVISAFAKYNHRTCPIVGDMIGLAVENGLEKFLKYLVDVMREEVEQKHMNMAVKRGQVRMVTILVGRGLSVTKNAGDSEGEPFVDCIKFAPPTLLVPTVKTLLLHGADERAKDSHGNTLCCILSKRTDICAKHSMEASQTLTSAATWRERRGFKEVCTVFYKVYKVYKAHVLSRKKLDKNPKNPKTSKKSKQSYKNPKKSKTSKKSNIKTEENSLLKLSEDLLAHVYSFMC